MHLYTFNLIQMRTEDNQRWWPAQNPMPSIISEGGIRRSRWELIIMPFLHLTMFTTSPFTFPWICCFISYFVHHIPQILNNPQFYILYLVHHMPFPCILLLISYLIHHIHLCLPKYNEKFTYVWAILFSCCMQWSVSHLQWNYISLLALLMWGRPCMVVRLQKINFHL